MTTIENPERIKEIAEYFKKVDWTWHRSGMPPTESKVEQAIQSSVDILERNLDYPWLSTGGLVVIRDFEDRYWVFLDPESINYHESKRMADKEP